MKLSKSKLALAKVINENGGWVDGEAIFAAMDGNGDLFGYSGRPQWTVSHGHWYGHTLTCWFFSPIVINNHHQTILSCEEYYQAYPKADADGWIVWGGGECPVSGDDIVDVAYSTYGAKSFSAAANSLRWSKRGLGGDIIAYRLHKPEVKPEFCESVTHGIPDSESIEELCAKVTEENKHQHVDAKPTIEQLAQDYRNKLDYANRKRKEADDAKAEADAALGELERAGDALGLLIGIAKPEPELVITDWRKLRVGDVVEITGSDNGCWKELSGMEMTVENVYPDDWDNDNQVDLLGESGAWSLGGNTTWRFIRRP